MPAPRPTVLRAGRGKGPAPLHPVVGRRGHHAATKSPPPPLARGEGDTHQKIDADVGLWEGTVKTNQENYKCRRLLAYRNFMTRV